MQGLPTTARNGVMDRMREALRQVPRLAWVILGVALIVRAGALGFIWSLDPAFDARLYHQTAISLVGGTGLLESMYPPDAASAIHPPGYPIVLAGLYFVFGENIHVGQVVGALAGVATVALIGVITWQLFRNRGAALIAAAIAALYPPLIMMSVTLMSESLFIPLALAGVAGTLRAREVGRWHWAAVAGALIGVATLMRVAGFVFLVLAALTIWRSQPRRLSRSAVVAPLTLLLVGALVWSLWSARNSLAMDRFVPFTTQVGTAYAGTYNDITRSDPRHEWRSPREIEPYSGILDRTDIETEAEMSAELSDAAWDYIDEHKTFPLTVAFANIKRAVELPPRSPSLLDSELMGVAPTLNESARVKALFWACQAGFLLVLALSLPAIIRGAWRDIPLPLLLLPFAIVATTVFFAVGMRYRVPTDFLLIGLAAVTLAGTRLGDWVAARAGVSTSDARAGATVAVEPPGPASP